MRVYQETMGMNKTYILGNLGICWVPFWGYIANNMKHTHIYTLKTQPCKILGMGWNQLKKSHLKEKKASEVKKGLVGCTHPFCPLASFKQILSCSIWWMPGIAWHSDIGEGPRKDKQSNIMNDASDSPNLRNLIGTCFWFIFISSFFGHSSCAASLEMQLHTFGGFWEW